MTNSVRKIEPTKRQETLVPQAAHSKLAKRALWFNTAVISGVVGSSCGIGLLTATYASLMLTGENSGYYLNLLGVFFPGYTSSPIGAWIGAFWAFLFAAISSAVVFQVYARAISMNFARSLSFDHTAQTASNQLVIMISPVALGVAIGTILAAQLVLSTSWLVVSGKASNSPHAALLAHYLPFYTVSIPGALIGAVSLFVYGFVFAYLFAFLYNLFVKIWVGAGHGK
jgi:hypothetical protein